MPLQLRHAVPEDIPEMRQVYYSAFGDTFIGSRVFTSDIDASNRFFQKAFTDDIADPLCELLVVTHKSSPDSKDEKVVSLAKWALPGATEGQIDICAKIHIKGFFFITCTLM
ncbi:hypothetical protein H9Q72_012403 [Fusarium xylarioides]|uniref:N-acetyltransferase domain-containing protein n=1 Tax=Fusarium xylarioides TaxID=221167 RepID=A0A9P7HKZ8_9HYPO|nr:hypothetical protein H9Q72_012403 [Fusarium xylarioides]